MSVISRISTLGVHQQTVSNFSKVSSDLANLQNQISSGVKSGNFKGMVGEVEDFTSLESQLDRIENYLKDNEITISRFETAFQSTRQMIAIVDGMEDLMARRNGADEDRIGFTQNLNNLQKSFVRELNSTYAGRFIFAGTKSNQPPVITDPSIPGPVEPGVPDNNYYQGSETNQIISTQDGFDFEFDIRADDSAFQKVMAAVSLGIQAHNEDDQGLMKQAQNMMIEGQRELESLQSRIGSHELHVRQVNDRHDSLFTYLRGIKEELIHTDLLEASTRVAVDQSILSATFQSFARISSLRLLDFLG